MYEFISVPKTGSYTLKKFLLSNYGDFFYSPDDSRRCRHCSSAKDAKNPIMTIRNPADRFESIYNYYMNGSEKWSDGKRKEVNVEKLLKGHYKDRSYFWDVHLRPQSWYLPEDEWEKSMVLVYEDDISRPVGEMINHLNLPDKKTVIKRLNVTKKTKIIFSSKNWKLIKSHYEKDFYLFDCILKNKHFFKKVFAGKN